MNEWWKECEWLKPSWWHNDGNGRKLVYTKHGAYRRRLYDLPHLTQMPKVTFVSADVDTTKIQSATFRAHIGGLDVHYIVHVPLFKEHGVVITCFPCKEKLSAHTSRVYRSHGGQRRDKESKANALKKIKSDGEMDEAI
jgi:hypothetical protein